MFASLKQLLILKNAPKAASKLLLLFRLSSAVIGQFSTHVMAGFRNNFQNPRRPIGAIFWIADGCLKAGRSFLKRVTGRNFRISTEVTYFKKQADSLYLIISTERQPNIVKAISADSKSTDMIFRTLKKYSSRDTIPLNNRVGTVDQIVNPLLPCVATFGRHLDTTQAVQRIKRITNENQTKQPRTFSYKKPKLENTRITWKLRPNSWT